MHDLSPELKKLKEMEPEGLSWVVFIIPLKDLVYEFIVELT